MPRPLQKSNSGGSTVQRLYGGADCSGQVERSVGSSSPVSINSFSHLHRVLSGRNDSAIFYERSQSCPPAMGSAVYVVPTCMEGRGFTLRVRNQCDMQNKGHTINIREENTAPLMNKFDHSVFQDTRYSDISPMFHIDIETSTQVSDHDSTCFNLQLTFSNEVDQETKYLVLQQEGDSIQWNDITDKCTAPNNPQNLDIPVKKSSEIWIIRLKDYLVRAFLAVIHGQVLFHILVYYRYQIVEKKRKIKVRVIGISEELYQNPKRLRTAITIAEEDRFRKCPENAPKLFLKKGKLDVKFHKGSKCVSPSQFDIGRNNVNQIAEWHDHSFDIDDLNDHLELKVADEHGDLKWSIDLNEMISDSETVQQPVSVTVTKPEIVTFEEEVMEHQIPWLARHLSKDVEKIAMLLSVSSEEIEAIKQSESAEARSISILKCWRRSSLSCGNSPTWSNIRTVLECDDVRRFDIIRNLLNQPEPSDEVLLWLVPRVAASFRSYAKILGVPDCEIEMISGSFEMLEDKCRAVLQRWRQRAREPTVNDLINALENDVLKKYDTAQKMREQFCER